MGVSNAIKGIQHDNEVYYKIWCLQRDIGVSNAIKGIQHDMEVFNKIWESPTTRYWGLQRDIMVPNKILRSPTRYGGLLRDMLDLQREMVFQRNKVSPMRYKGLQRDMGVSQRDRGNFNEIWEVFNGIGGFTTRNRGFYDIWGSPTSYEGLQREMQRCPNEKILYITPMMMISFAELVSLGSGAYARICPGG